MHLPSDRLKSEASLCVLSVGDNYLHQVNSAPIVVHRFNIFFTLFFYQIGVI